MIALRSIAPLHHPPKLLRNYRRSTASRSGSNRLVTVFRLFTKDEGKTLVTEHNGSMTNRIVTYRMYPNAVQPERLLEMLRLHQRLYNTALEDRIRVYKER